MTGDGNLTHIRTVLDEYGQSASLLWQGHRLKAALAQLEAAEAVIQAARALEPLKDAAEMRWMSMEDAELPVRARHVAELLRAVAALEDGQ